MLNNHKLKFLIALMVLFAFGYVCSSDNKDDKKEDKKLDNNTDKTKKKETPTEQPKVVYQTDILLSCEVDVDIIPKFADPNFWLDYFPPLGVKDLKSFGAGIDYSRSFITTEVNFQ